MLDKSSLDLLEISGGTYENFTALDIGSLNLKEWLNHKTLKEYSCKEKLIF